MNGAFDAASLARGYGFLDECPERFLADVITFPAGGLRERVEGLRRWRAALLAGGMPPSDCWPPQEIAGPVCRALADMDIARFCKGQPELVDALLVDILAAFRRQSDGFRDEVARCLRKLETLERIRLAGEEERRARWKRRAPREVSLDEAMMRHLRREAERAAARMDRPADARLLSTWGERARAWAEIAEVFGDLGEMLGRGWDMSLGVLRHTGWLDLVMLRKLVEQLPQVREIVQALGRLHASRNDDSVAERVFAPVRRLEEELHEVRVPNVPGETRGVERSGDIAWMLPVEASMLGHPKLRMLWHVRRAERALLSYRVEGVEKERSWTEREVPHETVRRTPRPDRGPIIAVVDTSGSMHGLPEKVAKALVLEALRTTHAERRRCILYAYSGPGQVLEHELDLTPEGVGRLLAFLGHSFMGGNDEAGVLAHVITRLKENSWKKADVLFCSDGEWPAPAKEVVDEVVRAREEGTRFHGVQIGNRGATGLHSFCDPVHVFADWAALAGWDE